MATPDTLTPEQLDRAAPALLKLLLQTGDKSYGDSIDAFDPAPSASNNWLRQADGSFAGTFIDEQEDGTTKRVKFLITKGADGWQTETELEQGTIDQSETLNYRAIVDSVLTWNGLNIGVQNTPGSVRFPRTSYAKKLRCGYGHLRGHYEDGRSLKGFIHPDLLNGGSEGKLYLLLQDDGETAQTKFMAGWQSKEDAIAAYSKEMPEDYLMELWEATPKQLAKFRKGEDFAEVDQEELDRVYSAYKSAVNMSATELKKWADSEASKAASLDRGPVNRNLELLQTPKSEWTQKHIAWANKTISFIARMKKVTGGEPVSKDIKLSKREISLRNWAYNPSKGKNYAEEFAEAIAVGTSVSWKYAGGIGKGKVIRKYTRKITLTLKGSKITRNGTKDNPALLIEQEGGDRVLKLQSEVSMSADHAEPIELSGSTELLDDAEWDALAEAVGDDAVVGDAMDAIAELDATP